MRHLPYFTLCAALAAASCAARAAGTIADVTIVDRDSGAALHTYYYHGEYWVAGRPGARYAIRIRNRLGERLLAVTSVDGVNVLSGETAAWDQAGYVFNPGESYQITGWRKTDAEVAAFTFTDSPNSYAQRTGRPANVGVIGVAVFRERQPQPVYTSPPIGQSPAAGPARYTSPPRCPATRWRGLRRRPRCAAGALGCAAGAVAEARHRPRRARILVRHPHRIPANAAATERDHPHSL